MIAVHMCELTSAYDPTEHAAGLSSAELLRLDTYRFPLHRNQFTAGRGILREMVRTYLSIDYDGRDFNYTKAGKPQLSHEDAWFNISHSHEQVVVVLSDIGYMGIDVERIQEDVDFLKLSDRYFSEGEREVLRQVSNEELASTFYTIWTRKEAFIKAHGAGLQIPLSCFQVNVKDEISGLKALDFGDESKDEWWIRDISVHEDYKCAICTNFAPGDDIICNGFAHQAL